MASLMISPPSNQLQDHVLSRTFRLVTDLSVEVANERIVLRGRALSFYAKQLAQEGVRELYPEIKLVNHIEVVN